MQNLFRVFISIVGLVILSLASDALAAGHRPPPSRAPEPLTLIGLGAGITGLYIARRRFTQRK